MRDRRIACLFMPHFLVEVSLRANLSLANRPIAVAEGASRREIVGAGHGTSGVEIGMTPKQARAACPGLVVVARDEVAERAAIVELLDALETCGPDVEGRAPGLCYFDATNLPAGETGALGAAIAVAKSLGFAGAASIADDKFTACCAAAMSMLGAIVVPPGGSAAFLEPLPMTRLPLAPGDADRFDLLGLRTIGQIAAMPVGPLAARFGERAREYVRLARGDDDEPLRPRHCQTVYEERFAFDDCIDRLEPLLFTLRGCIADLCARLAGAAQVCDKVELAIETTIDRTHSVITIPVMLAEPTASAATVFDLVRVALESRERLGEVEAAIVRTTPCGLPPPQMTLFGGAIASRRAALAATLARLRATLEPDGVVIVEPSPARSRLPERMQRSVPVASPKQMEPSDPPISNDVRPGVERSGRTWAPALRLVSPPKLIDAPNDASTCAGPFRLSESWWERPVDRDYYQLMDRAGGLMLVFRDLCDGRWYLQGVFD